MKKALYKYMIRLKEDPIFSFNFTFFLKFLLLEDVFAKKFKLCIYFWSKVHDGNILFPKEFAFLSSC